jgi:hypothetical protein
MAQQLLPRKSLPHAMRSRSRGWPEGMVPKVMRELLDQKLPTGTTLKEFLSTLGVGRFPIGFVVN